MTVAAYILGHPLPAPSRGGDCYAHDLSTGSITDLPHVHGPHRFRLPEHCAIQNGLLRLVVNAGSPPSLTMQVRRGRMIVDDYYIDTYVDLYGGVELAGQWLNAGVVTIDAYALTVVLTGVRLVDVNPEKVTIKLLAPLIGDAFVTLQRGWRSFRIQHGNASLAVPAPVAVARQVRLTDSPSPVGTASAGRVEEASPALPTFSRFVAAIDTVTADAGAFRLTSPAVTSADFGVGIGTDNARDRPSDLHRQLGDASRPMHLVREAL